tara:strand:+ start:5994 stop:7109 length:1116 start_codon:yes stop_codon:yes gene_type:complete
MARNRVIYQSEALYVSKEATSTGESNHEQLTRVQSANYSYSINRQDVNQYGQLARIDSLVLDPPTVSIDFSYYLTDGFNERVLDFYVETGDAGVGNFASGHMNAGSGVNVYVVTSPAGNDINLGGEIDDTDKIIGVGNCYLSDYSIDLSVGSLPTASCTLEGANMASSVGAARTAAPTIVNPSINQESGTPTTQTPIRVPTPTSGAGPDGTQVTALRPGDITMSLSNFDGETIVDLEGDDSCNVQSASISIPLSRSPLDRLGSKFPFAREVDFPVVSTLSVSALMNEETVYNLATGLEGIEKTVTITMNDVNGNGAIKWDFKGALVESENYSSSIGSNKSVDLTFTAQIGGPEDLAAGVFMSGANTGVVFG